MIPKECLRLLTSTRFRRRPSRLPGQPFRLTRETPLPRAKGSGEQSETIQPAVGHRDHHFSLHQMNPCQKWLNRASKPPVGSPELTFQQFGQGKIVSIVGSPERELVGQG